eukprot:Em0330g4a
MFHMHVERNVVRSPCTTTLPPPPPVVKWVCDVCRAPFDTKQAVAQHYRSHSSEDPGSPGHTSQSSPTDPTSRLTPTNNYSCEYCENSFPTRIGLRNHERARHQALVSASLSRAVSALTDTRRPSTQWSDEEVAKFLAAVNKYGLKHTSLIASIHRHAILPFDIPKQLTLHELIVKISNPPNPKESPIYP